MTGVLILVRREKYHVRTGTIRENRDWSGADVSQGSLGHKESGRTLPYKFRDSVILSTP